MSVVTVQVGQCGNQIGTTLFHRIILDANTAPKFTSINSSENVEFKQNVIEKYFTHRKNSNVLEAKAVLIDMEMKAIQRCKQKALKEGVWKFPDQNEYYQKRGAANNWALGYHSDGQVASENIIELCRSESEKCDYFGGFLILMSLAGGTGSGLGTKITYSLRDSFPEAMIVNHLVWPYSSGEVVVQNYNSLLTLSHLQQTSDLILAQQNDQLQKICSTLLGIKNVSFEHINDVIAHKLTSILQPSYANKFSSVSVLYELVQALACHPSYKLACVKNVPHISQRSMEYTTYIWPALLKHLRQMLIADAAMEEGVNWEIKVPIESASMDPRAEIMKDDLIRRHSFNKSVSNLLILRGKDVQDTDTGFFKSSKLYSSIIPEPYRFTQWQQYRSFNHHEKSATLVSNSQTFIQPLNNCVHKAWQMFNAHAYLHQYERYGLMENDFIDSFGVVEQIIANYSKL